MSRAAERLGQGGTGHIKCEDLGANPQNLCEHWRWSHVSVTLVLLWGDRRWRQESSQRPVCLRRARVPTSTRWPVRIHTRTCPLMLQTHTAPVHLNTRTHLHTNKRTHARTLCPERRGLVSSQTLRVNLLQRLTAGSTETAGLCP